MRNSVDMLSDGVKERFCAFLAGDLDIGAFEQWVYATPQLEKEMEADDYLDLISARYSDRTDKYEIQRVTQKYVDEGDHHTRVIKRDLRHIIDGTGNLPAILVEFYYLCCDGYGFLNTLGLDYGLNILCPPREYSADEWEDLSLDSQQKLLTSFFPDVVDEAKRILTWLNDGSLVLLGKGDDYFCKYEDNRVEETE